MPHQSTTTAFQKSKTLDNNYMLGDEIGKGAYGHMYKGLDLENGDFVAIKQVSLEDIAQEDINIIVQEIDLLKNLNHINIVKYFGSSKTKSHLDIILEYVENGSLANIIKPNKFGPFPESLVAVYITQVLEGLVYLYEQGVIHRDIKVANILTTKEKRRGRFSEGARTSSLDDMSTVGSPSVEKAKECKTKLLLEEAAGNGKSGEDNDSRSNRVEERVDIAEADVATLETIHEKSQVDNSSAKNKAANITESHEPSAAGTTETVLLNGDIGSIKLRLNDTSDGNAEGKGNVLHAEHSSSSHGTKTQDSSPRKMLGDEIGRGAYGHMYKGLDLENGDFVAIKQVSLEDIAQEDINIIVQEIDLLKNLNHINIVKYFGSSKTKSHLDIILEYVENGSLANIIKPNKFGPFPESLVAVYITQVLEGLVYLYEQGVIHRDIKVANILTTKEKRRGRFSEGARTSSLDDMSTVGSPSVEKAKECKTKLLLEEAAGNGKSGEDNDSRSNRVEERVDIAEADVATLETIHEKSQVDNSSAKNKAANITESHEPSAAGTTETVLLNGDIGSIKLRLNDTSDGNAEGKGNVLHAEHSSSSHGTKTQDSSPRKNFGQDFACIGRMAILRLLILLLLSTCAKSAICRRKLNDFDIDQVDILMAVAKSLNYPKVLENQWKGKDPCGNRWFGLKCEDGNIVGVQLNRLGLTGSISPNFSQLKLLKSLELANNNLTGTIPSELTVMPKLELLDVSHNHLHGKIPAFRHKLVVRTSGNVNIEGSGGGEKKTVRVVVVTAVAICIALLVIGCVAAYSHWNHKSGSDPLLVVITHNAESSMESLDVGKMMCMPIEELRRVTNNFSDKNVLGSGGFGTVFKGVLKDGTQIAVKRMKSDVMGDKGLDEFQSEIAVLIKVQHRNLVSLLGYCLDGNERLLIFEYMPGGNLSQYLFDRKEGIEPLEWTERVILALDVARGVEYLHIFSEQCCIHRDLKPSNILLGDDKRAKIADFGLARLVPDGQDFLPASRSRPVGTFGYLAPEYAASGHTTKMIDVYSFGVILMQLISGRTAIDETQPENPLPIPVWFKRIHENEENFPVGAIDPTLHPYEDSIESIRKVAYLAIHCCDDNPNSRPDMTHAARVLSLLTNCWEPPKVGADNNDNTSARVFSQMIERGRGSRSSVIGNISTLEIEEIS